MPNTEEEQFLLGVLPPGYFYQFSQDMWEWDQIYSQDKSECLWPKNLKLILSDFNESNCCTFDIQSGKLDRSSESILYKVCCGSKISTTDLKNWYFFYSHALQFPRHSMGMKFPCHFVGISSHIITWEWKSHKMSWEWNSHKASVGIVYYL